MPSRKWLSNATWAMTLVACLSLPTSAQAPRQRTFTFTYSFTVRNPHTGKPLRIWFPEAVSDEYQTVKLLSVSGDLPVKETADGEYTNHMFFAESAAASKPEYKFEAVYEVTRRERMTATASTSGHAAVRPAGLQRYLQADRLVPTTGRLAQIAAQQTQGQRTQIEKARAIYEYVYRNMRYDKTGTGWGRGDAEWACDSKHGNCTDFHSLFASMARSQGIPTRFAIGFSLPTDKHEGEIAGYHCWSDFWVDGTGWIPIDISEAWKHPEKHDYFFGSHDENRLQFSTGRDITLNPRQSGEPANYFVYPYVESDGQPWPNVSNAFSFKDASAVKQTAEAK